MRRLLLFLLATGPACESPGSGNADGDIALATGSRELTQAASQHPVLRAAEEAIASGHPWRATVLVAPLLKEARRPEATVLVAARAAAGWSGWTEVDKLLAAEAWLDTKFGGEGRELLARSALAQDDGVRAVEQARAAVSAAPTTAVRSRRLVFLARALDRAKDADGAAAAYLEAAEVGRPAGLAPVADWLTLRAAGARADASARAKLYATIKDPVARTRVDWTEAQARERFGDLSGAAERFAALGDQLGALRVRLAAARDSAAMRTVKDQLLVFIRSHSGSADARQAITMFDAAFPQRSPADELAVGRSAAASGVPARAITAFERSDAAALLSPEDRVQYGVVLGRAGRSAEGMAQLARVREPSRAAAQAAYQRARLMMSAQQPGGGTTRTALRAVVTQFPDEAETASAALYLLADLLVDSGDDAAARATHRELYSRYPTSARADDARFQAAIIDLAAGANRSAALQFDSLYALHPTAAEARPAQYWAGRAWKALDDTARANARWRAIVSAEPLSYYSMRAAKRLGDSTWRSAPRAAQGTPALDTVVRRLALLDELGMDAERRLELVSLDSLATISAERAPAIAATLVAVGDASRSIRIALKLLEKSDREPHLLQLAYPLVDREELERTSRTQTLDPALVAGLIRQESAFNPSAVSVANARGLMQVLPSVGQEVARSLGFPTFTPALLFDPDANLQIGTTHLAGSVRRYPEIERVLAAYNAGQTRVDRWKNRPGANDAELFVERIPYVETRDYVRIVLRNAGVYRSLYW